MAFFLIKQHRFHQVFTLLLSPESEIGIFRRILQGKLNFEIDPWPSISESAKDLIKKMLESNPKKRLTAHQVLCKFLSSELNPGKLDECSCELIQMFLFIARSPVDCG